MTEKTKSPKVCVIGIWHLGSVYSACLAELGYQVVGVDRDKTRVENLNKGMPPLFEPGLSELMLKNIQAKKLHYTTDISSGVKDAKFVFIAFDTKVDDNDDVDLSEVYDAVRASAEWLENGATIIVSSQVPVGTSQEFIQLVKKIRPSLDFGVAYVPENLRLGNAINIFMNPERIVIGADNDSTLDKVESFFNVIKDPKLRMNLSSAEMAKHALNSFLAMTVSFGNEIGNICDSVGADALKVAEALQSDSRIGRKAMIKPGLGFAGGTLARDIKALQKIAKNSCYQPYLIDGVYEVNKRQNKMVVGRLQKAYGSLESLTVAVFGLTYKAGTSTLRRSASLEIIRDLVSHGVKVKAYDPKADLREMKSKINFDFCTNPQEAAKDADALVFVTDWPEFKTLDFTALKPLMKKPVIIDAQNMLNASGLTEKGFTYLGMGRGTLPSGGN